MGEGVNRAGLVALNKEILNEKFFVQRDLKVTWVDARKSTFINIMIFALIQLTSTQG